MLSPKIFTEFLQDIFRPKSFDLGQGIPVDTLLIVYLLFADDSANGLQKQLTALYKYASLWHVIISISKTTVLILTKRHTSECDSFYNSDDVIEKAETYKYLGAVYSTKYPKNVLKKRSFISLLKLVKQLFLYKSNLVL